MPGYQGVALSVGVDSGLSLRVGFEVSNAEAKSGFSLLQPVDQNVELW